eukprot:TRINITY_DN25597_c0_g1_i2.p1 TRINITY_DN25597_c0_g1~~TRINITY_DN25597_c0_g1_i2.p1  ORF type:complete len:332 (+),score=99.27 TRINITY_DN25597_c0_g1_i2:109-1104(+)
MSKLHGYFLREAASVARWTERRAGPLRGLAARPSAVAGAAADGAGAGEAADVAGRSRSLVWAHGLGGSCAADGVRGLAASVLDAEVLRCCVLRLDLRGHGASLEVHEPERAAEQYEWSSQAQDLLAAAASSAEGEGDASAGAAAAGAPTVFGGEASGAGIALHAAVAAGSDAAGVILMRPPTIWAARMTWQARYRWTAQLAEGEEGLQAKAVEEEAKPRLLRSLVGSEVNDELLSLWRSSTSPAAYAAALRGLAASDVPADDALRALRIPALILAVPGDAEHPVEAAEDLAAMIPGAELEVAQSLSDLRENWGPRIARFLEALPRSCAAQE